MSKGLGPSHAPYGDPLPVRFFLPAEDLLLPRQAFRAVEDHQMALVRSGTVHVGSRLDQPFPQRFLEPPVPQIALDSGFLPPVRLPVIGRKRPYNQQVGAHPAETVLPLDPAPAVEDPLQKGLQEQLWARLPVVEAPYPMFRILAEILLEAFEQLRDLQPAVLAAMPLT